MNRPNLDMDASLIISHYNKAKYLEQAIFSGINQSVPFMEVIVVDDCSRDDQKKKAKNICDNLRVQLILRKTNGGPSAARNDGIRASKGEWIQILDADDYLTRDSLKNRLKALLGNQSTFWIAGQYAKVGWFVTPRSLESRILNRFPWFKLKPEPVIEPQNVPKNHPWKVQWPHQAILFHRSLFEKYGLYDEMVRLGQDKEIRWRFWYATQTTPTVVKEIVYVYRQGHRGRLTHKSNHLERQKCLNVMMENIERRKTEGITSENTEFL